MTPEDLMNDVAQAMEYIASGAKAFGSDAMAIAMGISANVYREISANAPAVDEFVKRMSAGAIKKAAEQYAREKASENKV